MVNLIEKAEQWPRRKSGEIVFKTTHDAIFYANLIYDNKPLIDEIDKSLKAARNQLSIMRRNNNPNLDLLMEIAVKAQLFRECLDEVMRIMVEQPEGRE